MTNRLQEIEERLQLQRSGQPSSTRIIRYFGFQVPVPVYEEDSERSKSDIRWLVEEVKRLRKKALAAEIPIHYVFRGRSFYMNSFEHAAFVKKIQEEQEDE